MYNKLQKHKILCIHIITWDSFNKTLKKEESLIHTHLHVFLKTTNIHSFIINSCIRMWLLIATQCLVELSCNNELLRDEIFVILLLRKLSIIFICRLSSSNSFCMPIKLPNSRINFKNKVYSAQNNSSQLTASSLKSLHERSLFMYKNGNTTSSLFENAKLFELVAESL